MECLQCKIEFEPSRKDMIYCSNKCKSLAYYYNNQGNCYLNQKNRGLVRKIDLINRSGGKCSSCGYDKNLAALTFHHLDPEVKSFELDMRSLSNRSQKVIDAEFKKCILLCANCHFELHNPTYTKESTKIYDDMKPKVHKIENLKCERCNIKLTKYRKYCDDCFKIIKGCDKPNMRKIERPSKEILEKEIWEIPTNQLSKKYKVSDKAITKWCKRYKIDKPPRGYWSKKQTETRLGHSGFEPETNELCNPS